MVARPQMTHELNHPTLGRVKGPLNRNTVQFVGIQYARLAHILAEPELITSYQGNVVEATAHGPQVISLPEACSIEHRLIQHALPFEQPTISRLDGLHLSITRPLDLGENQKLPVLVFIHGGGFMMGSSTWPQYDQARFIELASEMGKPVIGVSINYRLGAPGFLFSQELRETGIKTNNGLRDQRAAFIWVQQHIAGFGGDPNKVTVIGQSAGAVAALLHLQSTTPLFNQLISMSGSPFAMPLLDLNAAENSYSIVIKSLELGNLTTAQRVKKLLTVPEDDILSKVPFGTPLSPVLDDDLIHESWSTFDVSSLQSESHGVANGWCQRFMVGSCGLDTSVYNSLLVNRPEKLSDTKQNLLSKIQAGAHPNETSPKRNVSPTDTRTILKEILDFGSDIAFLTPTLALAEAQASTTFVYRFLTPNPWDGAWKSEATHILDVALLFQNYNNVLPDDVREIAVDFAKHVILFIHGKNPYPGYKSDRPGVMIYEPGNEGVTARFSQPVKGQDLYKSQWLKGTESISSEHLEALLRLWHSLIRGQ